MVLQMAESIIRDRRDRKQGILTNLALLSAEVLQKAESRIRDRDRKQRILANLALLPAEVLQKAESRIRDRGGRSREY